MSCENAQERNHSDDMVTVHSGLPEPIRLCGYHAQPSLITQSLANARKDS